MSSLQQRADALDSQDALRHYQKDFELPKGTVYLDGNSLGPLPVVAKSRAKEVTEQQWGNSLIASWNQHDWIRLPQQIGAKLAPILGANSDEVIACDSISVNLFKLLSCALQLNSPRRIVVSEEKNFPTDLYMVQGLSQQLGSERCELLTIEKSDIEKTITERGSEIAVLMLTHVDFRSGEVLDMQKLTKMAHENGIIVIWDLAHSAGILPLQLSSNEVDFAVGCTYKYLNGGPGAPAFIYANQKHHKVMQQPLSGWMGHKSPFEFTSEYKKAEGVDAFLCGTPPVISMSVLDASLDLFAELDMDEVLRKSHALSNFFHEALNELLQDNELVYASPQESIRGGQIAYEHPKAYEICQALIAQNVIGDFRAPNILRLGFSPLYLSFNDVLRGAEKLVDILKNKTYMKPEFAVRSAVT